MGSMKRGLVISLFFLSFVPGYAKGLHPFQYVIELGVGNGNATNLYKAVTAEQPETTQINAKLFNPKTFIAGLQIKYGFTEYWGAGINPLFIYGDLTSYETTVTPAAEEGAKAEPLVTTKKITNGARIDYTVYPLIIYPFGQQNSETTLWDIHAGWMLTIPLSGLEQFTYNMEEGVTRVFADTLATKKDLKIGYGVIGGIGYQDTNGLTLALDYSHQLSNFVPDVELSRAWCIYAKIGCNLCAFVTVKPKKKRPGNS